MLSNTVKIAIAQWISGVSLLLVNGVVSSQHMNAEDAPCRTPDSNVKVTQCFADAQAMADKNLNHTYNEILKNLEPDEKKLLIEAERLWVKFRNASCRAERSLYGTGSGAYTAYVACMEAMTRQRTEDLSVAYGWRIGK
jgi:uncharacterized protein YecT (DUF1311 family)